MAVPPALYAAGALDWGEFLHYFTAPSRRARRRARAAGSRRPEHSRIDL